MKKIYHAPQTVVYSISGSHPLASSPFTNTGVYREDYAEEEFTNKKSKDTPHPIWG